MPPLVTYIARVSDGLPFVASFAPTHENVEEQKRQSKEILSGLSSNGRYVVYIDSRVSSCLPLMQKKEF
jgi:hypothetical protein